MLRAVRQGDVAILVGSSYTREGEGQPVERLYREVRSYAISGGSLEVLNLFAVEAAKLWHPARAR